MADRSSIEWTQATWNPVTGCDRVSAGCDNCYALTLARRLKAMGSPKYQHNGDPRTSGPGFAVTIHPDTLTMPARWRHPRTVFVNSMSDLFHARAPATFVREVFDVMAATPQHTYQVLTKRAVRLARLAPSLPWPSNVWIGVSVEDAATPYDLRHAGVTGWLNAGVPVPEVAEWAGHSPEVLWRIYAKCVDSSIAKCVDSSIHVHRRRIERFYGHDQDDR
jgi:protein gp37